MNRPVLQSGSAEEFISLCNGTFSVQVKLVAAMWMASLARRNPNLRLITMSPGNTLSTEVAGDSPLPVRILMKYVHMRIVMPLLGIVQSVDKGARQVGALTDESLKSGVFYASKTDAPTRPVVNQSTITELVNTTYQDSAGSFALKLGGKYHSKLPVCNGSSRMNSERGALETDY